MGKYTLRIVIGFIIFNILLAAGIGLMLWARLGTFDEFLGGLGPGLIGFFLTIAAGVADLIYLIFVLVRKSRNN